MLREDLALARGVDEALDCLRDAEVAAHLGQLAAGELVQRVVAPGARGRGAAERW
jgi:hypothetical protein